MNTFNSPVLAENGENMYKRHRRQKTLKAKSKTSKLSRHTVETYAFAAN